MQWRHLARLSGYYYSQDGRLPIYDRYITCWVHDVHLNAQARSLYHTARIYGQLYGNTWHYRCANGISHLKDMKCSSF